MAAGNGRIEQEKQNYIANQTEFDASRFNAPPKSRSTHDRDLERKKLVIYFRFVNASIINRPQVVGQQIVKCSDHRISPFEFFLNNV